MCIVLSNVLLSTHIVTLVFFTNSSCIFSTTYYSDDEYSIDILKVFESNLTVSTFDLTKVVPKADELSTLKVKGTTYYSSKSNFLKKKFT